MKRLFLFMLGFLVILASFLAFYLQKKEEAPRYTLQKEIPLEEKTATPKKPVEKNEYKVIFLSDSLISGLHTDPSKEAQVAELKKLFQLIKKETPDAIIFMGNMVEGLGGEIVSKQTNLFIGEKKETKKTQTPFDPIFYKKQLNTFSKIYEENIGSDIPLLPLIGDLNQKNSRAIEIFRDHFKIKNSAIIDENQLAYTKEIGNAFFVLLATNWTDQQVNSENILVADWLKSTLGAKREEFPYLFVVGNQPIYSSTHAVGNYKGLDRFSKQKNQFWKILRDNKVLAYFCGKEPLFDRTLRNDVWHIISGGAKVPHDNYGSNLSFYHYLRLTYSKERQISPKVEVIDDRGYLRDSVEMDEKGGSIYQLRISQGNKSED